MLIRQERIALLLLIVVTGIVAGGAAIIEAIGRSQFATAYSPSLPDGTLVILEGKVERISHTREGNHLLLRVNNTSIFIPATASAGLRIAIGDEVRVLGTLQTYRGEREIVVRGSDDIAILR